MNGRLMLKAVDVAYVWGLGRDSVYAGAADGTIPAIKVGRSIRFPAHRIAETLGCSVEDLWEQLAERDATRAAQEAS